MAFQNRLSILINAPFFERELKKFRGSRCDYRKLLEFLSDDNQNNILNNEGRLNDIVRAFYFYPQTVFRNNQFESRTNLNHAKFLNALRMIGYEVKSAYNSVDALLCLQAIQLADSGAVDTIVLAGTTIDHVSMIWHLKSKGRRIVGMFADAHSMNDRVKEALDWYYIIRPEDGFLNASPPQGGDHSSDDHDQVDGEVGDTGSPA